MNSSIEEKISAFADQELSQQEFSMFSQAMADDRRLQQQLHRYGLISEAIKSKNAGVNAGSLASRVSAQLKDEPVILAPRQQHRPVFTPMRKQLAAVAIAASVATVAVLNMGSFLSPAVDQPAFPVTAGVDAKAQPRAVDLFPLQTVASGPVSKTGYRADDISKTRWKTLSQQPGVEEELNQLLMDHSEYTHETGVPGLLPYATIVVYDKNK